MNRDTYETQTMALILNGTADGGHLIEGAYQARQTDPARADAIADRALHTAQVTLERLAALSELMAHVSATDVEREIDRSSLQWLQASLADQALMWLSIAEKATPAPAPKLQAVA